MTNLTPDLDAIRARLSAIVAGEWYHEGAKILAVATVGTVDDFTRGEVAFIANAPNDITALLDHADKQQARIEGLEAAIGFYADEANWQTRDGDDPYPLVDNDGGDIARDALKGGG